MNTWAKRRTPRDFGVVYLEASVGSTEGPSIVTGLGGVS